MRAKQLPECPATQSESRGNRPPLLPHPCLTACVSDRGRCGHTSPKLPVNLLYEPTHYKAHSLLTLSSLYSLSLPRFLHSLSCFVLEHHIFYAMIAIIFFFFFFCFFALRRPAQRVCRSFQCHSRCQSS